jgi:hypothetical protein
LRYLGNRGGRNLRSSNYDGGHDLEAVTDNLRTLLAGPMLDQYPIDQSILFSSGSLLR